MNSPYRWVYMTTSSRDEAKTIGKALLQRRLAACVNLFDGMTSMYHWKGSIEESSETVLVAKTHERHVPALQGLVVSMHSYECPCVVVLPIQSGFPDYLKWLDSETADDQRSSKLPGP